MRNTTKLKHILVHYSICMDMDEKQAISIHMVAKENPDQMFTVEAESYSRAVAKAYAEAMKRVKKGK
ncbi:MAG: hypothetical protein ACOZCO_03630 [Bacteroidota bacterium]